MKTWEYFHIEHFMMFAKSWNKNLGWSVWHSCFNYDHGCGSSFLVLSGVWS